MPRHSLILLLGACLLVASASSAQAVPLVPAGLSPGDPYHLVFVTQDPGDAVSTSIADYNTFVNNQAALSSLTGANVGVQYFVLGSTASIDAITNALVTAPVYNFNPAPGGKVADTANDLWDGTLDTSIFYDQFGNSGFPDIWTGTLATGLGDPGLELGASSPRTGLANNATSLWINDSVSPNTTTMRFYALSQELTVPPSSVPEPSALLMGLLTLVGVGLIRRLARSRPS